MAVRRLVPPIVLSVAIAVILLCLPATGWIVRQQLATSLGLPVSASARSDDQRRAALARRPDDPDSQALLATMAPGPNPGQHADRVVDALDALAARFHTSSAIRAHLLRYATRAQVRIGRPEEESWSSPSTSSASGYRGAPPREPSADELARYLRASTDGERLDPGNAYFPMMACVGLLAAHHDSDALTALHRAAALITWDDCLSVDTQARLRLATQVNGPQSALAQGAVAGAALFPHYAEMRSAARVLVYLAAQKERAGQYGEGMRIRHDLMRVAAVLRAESHSAIGSLVGCALTSIAARRPEGAEALERGTRPAAGSADDRNEAAYLHYLGRRNRADEAAWARQQFAAAKEAKSIVAAGLGSSDVCGQGALALAALWGVGTALAAYAVWLAVLAAAAALSRRAGARRWETMCLSFVGPLLLAWLWVHAAAAVRLAVEPAPVVLSHVTVPTTWETIRPTLIACAALLPAALALGMAIARALRGEAQAPGAAPGLVRGVAVVLPIYAVVVGATVRQEAAVSAGLQRTLEHEGRYLAECVHRRWPPADPTQEQHR